MGVEEVFMKKKILIVTLLLMFIIPVVSSLIYNSSKVSADVQITVSYESVQGQISGTFQFIDIDIDKRFYNKSNGNFNIDVNGGILEKNGIDIICYPQNFGSNQQFKISYADSVNNDLIYIISPLYSNGYVLDVDNASSDDGTRIQLWGRNATKAQKFMFKEVHVTYNGEKRFLGYVILTGASQYKKALKRENGRILQYTLPTEYNPDFYWDLQQVFDAYQYTTSGYKYYDQQPGVYREDIWKKISRYDEYSNAFQITNNNTNNSPRFGIDSKYTFFDSASIKISQNSVINLLNFYNYKIIKQYDNKDYGKLFCAFQYDESSLISGNTYVEGGLGCGLLQIIYTDAYGKTQVTNRRDFMNRDDSFISGNFWCDGQILSSNRIFNIDLNFDKIGDYTIKIYYKVKDKYLEKEYSFSIIPSNYDCEILTKEEKEEDEQVLANYTFSLDSNNNIQVNYSGSAEKQADTQTLINYVSGAYQQTNEADKVKTIENFKETIKKYNIFKIAFSNKAFYLDAYANRYVAIQETEQGPTAVVSNLTYQKSNANSTDGIYHFISQNIYFSKQAYYRVYMQSMPTTQVFRNATYVYANEHGQNVNYASDYAFVEIKEEFPYTLVTKVFYEFTDEKFEPISERIDYKSKEILYNTTKSPKYLKFSIEDIAGNKNEMYLCILPSNAPHVNYDNFSQWSLKYNYIMNGYVAELYNPNSKNYEKHIYSSFDIARENVFKNIIENDDICKLNDNGEYEVVYKPFTNNLVFFETNEDLVNWMYSKCDENIKYITINPSEYNNYVFDEVKMHTETIYLEKDYYFTSDANFPLFESYKIKFEYYSSKDNKLLKSGYITYNGQYRYGQTLYEILADNQENNWIDGYVKFTEYNISANAGIRYVGYIVKDNPIIRLRLQEGNYVKYINIDNVNNLECESFEIAKVYNAATAVIVNFNGISTTLDNDCLQNYKFIEAGIYTIKVLNTHGLEYEINIVVSNLSKYFSGIKNYETTNCSVLFKPNKLDFMCYINGEAIKNINYVESDEGYIIVFDVKEITQNIVIHKDGKIFSFIIFGEVDPNLKIYEMYNEYNCSINDIKLLYSSLLDNYIELEEKINIANELLDDESQGARAFAAASKSIEEHYNSNKIKFLMLQSKVNDLNQFLEKINSIENPIFKKNENYIKINKFKTLMLEVDKVFIREEESFVELAKTFYNSLGIKNVDNELIDILIDYNTAELTKTVEDYKDYISLYYNKYINLLVNINGDISSYYNKLNSYMHNAEVIERYNSGFNKCEALITILKNLSQEKKDFKLNVYKFTRRLKNIKIDFNNPIYKANEYTTLKNIYDSVETEINNLSSYDINFITGKIEGNILNVVNTSFDYYIKVINEDLGKLNSSITKYERIANGDTPFCPYSAIKKAIETKNAKKDVAKANECLNGKVYLLKEDIKTLRKLQNSLENYSCSQNIKCAIATLKSLVESSEKLISKANNI